MSVGNSRLSLVATLKDLSNAEGVSTVPRKFFIALNQPNLSLTVFVARNLPVCFVNSKTVAPFLGSVVSLNLSRLIKSGLRAIFRCLYNAVSLSCFAFCLNRKVVSFSVEPRIVNDVSSNLLVFGVL